MLSHLTWPTVKNLLSRERQLPIQQETQKQKTHLVDVNLLTNRTEFATIQEFRRLHPLRYNRAKYINVLLQPADPTVA